MSDTPPIIAARLLTEAQALATQVSTLASDIAALVALLAVVVTPPAIAADGDYLGVDPVANSKPAKSALLMADGTNWTLVNKQLLANGKWDGITANVTFATYLTSLGIVQYNGTNWYDNPAGWAQLAGDPRIPPVVVTPGKGPFTYNALAVIDYGNNKYGTAEADATLAQVKALGANSIEIGYMLGQSDVNTISGPQQPDANYLHILATAKSLGLQVFMKVYDLSAGGSEGSLAPTDLNAFFKSYTAAVVQAARIAQQGGAVIFGIGNEMFNLSNGNLPLWTSLISQVRAVYKGKLTYSSINGEGDGVVFWGQLDYIGVDAYFPLTTLPTPTYQQMHDAWTQPNNETLPRNMAGGPLAYCQTISKKYGKQVIFAEIGYGSNTGGAMNYGASPEQWYFNQSDPFVNLPLQADAWRATMDVMIANNQTNWFAGLFVWSYSPFANVITTFGYAGFEIQNKPAATVLQGYFSK